MPPNPDRASALLQECRLVLTMLSASSRLLVFHENASEAAFVGNPHLVEYTVGRVSVEVMNQRDFAVMHVKSESCRSVSLVDDHALGDALRLNSCNEFLEKINAQIFIVVSIFLMFILFYFNL